MWRALILLGLSCASASPADLLGGGVPQIRGFEKLDPFGDRLFARRLTQSNNDDERARRTREFTKSKGDLLRAAFNGDLKTVQEEIGKGLDPDVRSPGHGFTALMNAASRGHVDVMAFLLDSGADIGVKNDEGISALYLAAQENQLEAVRKLLDAGADTEESKDANTGITPLIIAAERGSSEIVRELLSRGADANAKDLEDTTALHFAARLQADKVGIVEALLDDGAGVNSQDSFGYTPLHFAAWNGQKTNVEILLKRGANAELETILQQNPKDLACGCLRTDFKEFCHIDVCENSEDELLDLLE